MVKMPGASLRFRHRCLAAYHRDKRRDDHAERRYRKREHISLQQADEHQALDLLAHVVKLMREPPHLDPARVNSNEKPSKIAAGALPQEQDFSSYAAYIWSRPPPTINQEQTRGERCWRFC